MSGWRGRQSARSETSLLLDRRTNSVWKQAKPQWERVLTCRAFPKSGVVEFGYSKVKRGGSQKDSSGEVNKEENKLRSLRRRRANVRRQCLQMQAAYILTLTYHENMIDRKTALYHRQQFDRRMKEIHGDQWLFLAVMERQKRGAWHHHIVTAFQVDREVVLREWRMVTGDPTITQVDVGFKPNGKGNCYSKCASYVAKYVGKDVEGVEEGSHAYHINRGSAVQPERFTIAAGAPADTETRMILDLTKHYLGVDVSMWAAPVPDGSCFGFIRAERNYLQAREVT